ncbi:MAG: exonuclease SbcCD subunit D [Pseudomonadota bacterium]
MRILHTADLHLGRAFEGHSLVEDQQAILDQIAEAIRDHTPDVLIIAGDIYDRATPPVSAVAQFNAFMRTVVSETKTAIVIIAGNHDQGDRIGAMATFADPSRALIRGPLQAEEPALVLDAADGPVAFSGLPFGYEYAARDVFGDNRIASPEDVLRAQVASARRAVPDNARWVIAAHTFATGADPSEIERPISRTVGTIETVGTSVFADADYVALGHLHRPQNVGGEHICYAGAPLAYGFDEAGQTKSMSLVTLAADGAVPVEFLPFRPLRSVRTLEGTLDALLSGEAQPETDDFVKVTLTDAHRPIDPMRRIRTRYPYACGLSYSSAPARRAAGASVRRSLAFNAPADVINTFAEHVRGAPLTEAERAIVAATLRDIATDADTPPATGSRLNANEGDAA